MSHRRANALSETREFVDFVFDIRVLSAVASSDGARYSFQASEIDRPYDMPCVQKYICARARVCVVSRVLCVSIYTCLRLPIPLPAIKFTRSSPGPVWNWR